MSATEEVLQAFYQIREALMEPDTATLNALIAQDYRGFDLRGHVETRDVILEFYRPGVVRLEVFEVSDIRTHVSGSLGIVTGRGSLTGSYGDDQFAHTVLFCDLFELRDARWQLLFTQTTEVEEAQ